MSNVEKINAFKIVAAEMFSNLEIGILNIAKGENVKVNSSEVQNTLLTLKNASLMLELNPLYDHLHVLELSFNELLKQSFFEKKDIDFFSQGIVKARELINEKPLSTAAATSKSKGLIYLIDDEPEILKDLQSVIAPYEFTVKLFSNGKEATTNLKKDNPDAIISDINMPEMNGVEFLKYCEEHKIEIPIIFVSGYASKAIMFECINHGAYAFIEKPFKEEQVIASCLSAVKKNQTQKILSKSVNSVLYQFGDIDKVLELYGQDDMRESLRIEIEKIIEQKMKLKGLIKD